MTTVAFFDTKPYDREYFGALNGAGLLRFRFHDFRLSKDTAGSVGDASAVCVFVNERVDRACLEVLHQAGVRLVALRCAGYNNVDLDAARALGIGVVRVPAYSPHAVAEHTLALLLALNRKLHRAYNRVREHNFSLHGLVGFDLHGKTAGVVGTGRIGRIVAQLLRGFGMEVLAYDPLPNPAWATAHTVTYTDFRTLLGRSHIVTLHLPLTPATRHLLNAGTLAEMKPGAFLVNTSRGKLVETGALIDALKEKRLGGVALDVYEEEEGLFFEDHSGEILEDNTLSRLLTFPNVLVTAHQAFLTHEALEEIMRVTTENLGRLESGADFLPETVLVPPPTPV